MVTTIGFRPIWKWAFVPLALAAVALFSHTSAVAEDPIKICVIDDHSGDFALPNIPKTHGAQLAVDELNAAGGGERRADRADPL